MKEIQVLLYRNLLELKTKYLSYVLFWFLLPMIFYLLLTLPLIELYKKLELIPIGQMGIKYDKWFLTGLWICSATLFSFLYSFVKLRDFLVEQNQLQKYLKTPISNGQFLFSLLISSVLTGIVQLAVSMLITLNLDFHNISVAQLSMIFGNIFLLIIFFSILGLLCGFYIKDSISSGLAIFFAFIFISFSLGTVLPLNEHDIIFPFIGNLPIYELVLNTHRVIAQDSINMLALLLSVLINGIMFSIVVVLSYKKFRK